MFGVRVIIIAHDLFTCILSIHVTTGSQRYLAAWRVALGAECEEMVFIYRIVQRGVVHETSPALKLYSRPDSLNVTPPNPLHQHSWMTFPDTKMLPITLNNFHLKQPTALQAAMLPFDTSTPSSSAYPSKTPVPPACPLSDADNNHLSAARLETQVVYGEKQVRQ